MKKQLSIILAALMISALFCGCTRNDNDNVTASPDTGVTATPGNTPNTAPDTPDDSILDSDADTTDEGIMDMEPNNTDGQGILGDVGEGVGDVVGDVGNTVEDIGDDIAGNDRNNNGGNANDANVEPTAGGANGARSKR